MAFLRPRRSLIFGAIIILALLAFELFNYSTTDFALNDLLGNLNFAGLRWSTILAIAFCGIDFAGIARLFTPEQGAEEPAEVWYLFGAWLLAATMNAMLTWWGVSIAILHDQTLGNAIIERQTLLKAVPVFVAVMVWLSRVLIIGTFSVAGDRLFAQADLRTPRSRPRTRRPAPALAPARRPTQSAAFRPTPKPAPLPQPEPTYHPVALGARQPERPPRRPTPTPTSASPTQRRFARAAGVDILPINGPINKSSTDQRSRK
jgi:hypothetical protein